MLSSSSQRGGATAAAAPAPPPLHEAPSLLFFFPRVVTLQPCPTSSIARCAPADADPRCCIYGMAELVPVGCGAGTSGYGSCIKLRRLWRRRGHEFLLHQIFAGTSVDFC